MHEIVDSLQEGEHGHAAGVPSGEARALLAQWFAELHGASVPLTGLADNLLASPVIDAIVAERSIIRHPAESPGGYDPAGAIRLECHALREERPLHPARPDAADIIEAHLDQLLRLVAAWRIEAKP